VNRGTFPRSAEALLPRINAGAATRGRDDCASRRLAFSRGRCGAAETGTERSLGFARDDHPLSGGANKERSLGSAALPLGMTTLHRVVAIRVGRKMGARGKARLMQWGDGSGFAGVKPGAAFNSQDGRRRVDRFWAEFEPCE